MAYLPFIRDEDLVNAIDKTIKTGLDAKINGEKDFYKNVIDPFGAIFETAVGSMSTEEWKVKELMRQNQKTLQNQVGEFHNIVLGSVRGWKSLGKGMEIDLENLEKHNKKIIAEIKNKYNTVTGSKRKDHYEEFENLVCNKSSKYFGATAYFVQIIPKNAMSFNCCFTPSDKAKGIKKPKNEQIREIDGRSFYALVTGIEDALDQLYKIMPQVIIDHNFSKHKFTEYDKDTFLDFYSRAYKG